MRHLIFAAGALGVIGLSACASDYTTASGYGYDRHNTYMTACERDYQNNRNAATAAGAIVGGAAGALIGREIGRDGRGYRYRYHRGGGTAGALIGGALGALVGSEATRC